MLVDERGEVLCASYFTFQAKHFAFSVVTLELTLLSAELKKYNSIAVYSLCWFFGADTTQLLAAYGSQ